MSASITAAPARSSFGRIPSAFAALALVVVLAVSVALVAMNGSKVAAPSIDAGIGAPPIGYDHGSSSGETVILPKTISHFGGWGGPRLAPAITPALKGPVYLGDPKPYTGGAPRGVRSNAQ